MKTRMLLWVLIVGCLTLGGCSSAAYFYGLSEFRPIHDSSDPRTLYEFSASSNCYPDHEERRIKFLELWLATNDIPLDAYRIVDKRYVRTHGSYGRAYYTIEVKEASK